MKKLTFAVVALLAIATILPLVGFAAAGGIPSVSPLGGSDLYGLIITVFNWLFGLLMVAAAIMVLYAGVQYLQAGSDPGKAESAKNILIYAAVAIVVAALAFVFVRVIASLIGVGSSV